MRELPAGTVTLLFTDIEGSTKLLDELGPERYAEALAEHRRHLREAFARHGGVEVDTQGDAFFYAFATPTAALTAAESGQRALAAGPIRVRVGIHTGTPLVSEEGYVGNDVHKAARIMAAARAGQVIVSATTQALAADAASLRDLGEHRLKDLGKPIRLYQLGEGDFPAPATLHRTNLPVPATPFLGRVQELDDVRQLLENGNAWLITLTGPGCTGKTRLAAQAAAECSGHFRDGVWWVPLAALRDPELVLPAIADALEIGEEPGRRPAETLAQALGGKRMLLLLDNAEQLLPGLAHEIPPLRDADGPTVLVTSRERLQVAGERLYDVPPLGGVDGTSLFVDRAASLGISVEPSPAIATLCGRLDGLPLAIELAAARTPLFSADQLLERLSKRLDVLKGGRDADPRQQTLRATIDWSHTLLDADEQLLFRRLAIFAGGCTYEAAEAISAADPDTLQALIEKSLLRRRDDEAGEPRFWMLETIREYASEQLGAEGVAELERRYAEYFLQRLYNAERKLRTYERQCLARLRADYENYRQLLTRSDERGDDRMLLALASRLWRFWYHSSFLREGHRWLDRALQSANDGSLDYADALHGKSVLLLVGGQIDEGEARQREAFHVFQKLKHSWGIAEILNDSGRVALIREDLVTAAELLGQSRVLAREIAEPWLERLALLNLGDAAMLAGDFDAAIHHASDALELASAAGDDDHIASAYCNRGYGHLLTGDLVRADADLHHALAGSLALGRHELIAWSLIGLAAIRLREGERLRVARLLGAVERWADDTGVKLVGVEGSMLDELLARLEGDCSESVRRARDEGRSQELEDAAREVLGKSMPASNGGST